jgi:hypothetical protein
VSAADRVRLEDDRERPPGQYRQDGTLLDMVSLDDVAAMACAMPGVAEGERHGNRTWSVGGKAFMWERPFSKADIKRFGDEEPPAGTIVAIRVEDLVEKEAVLGAGTKGIFTIPHFNGYPAVLVQLKTVTKRALREAVVDGWLACAPAELVDEYHAGRRTTKR